MHKGQVFVAICLTFLLLCRASNAFALPETTAVGAETVPESIAGAFESVMLVDLTADAVLYEKDASRTFSPTGSAVTLMNAYLVMVSVEPGTEIRITTDLTVLERDSRRIGLTSGEVWLVEDLVAVMLLYGAQDAALVLAEHLHDSPDAFTFVMNQMAKTLGMDDTVYVNPFGAYNSGQSTTAHDLMLLAEEIYKNEMLREMLSASAYTPSGHNGVENRLRLLQAASTSYDARVTGMGMGTTSLSGTNMIISAQEDGREILMTSYSTSTDQTACETAAKGWLNYGFNEFRTVDCAQAASLAAADGVTLGDDTVSDCDVQGGSLPVVAGRTLADRIEEPADGFSLRAEGLPYGQTLEAALLYDGAAIRNVTLNMPGDIGIPALAVPEETAEPSHTEIVTPSPEVPFYTSEDWQQPGQSVLGEFGWLIIIIGAAAGCAAVYFILIFVRKRIR